MQPRPLTGYRILELGGYISGPYASSFLHGMGADVVKLESVNGDDFRRHMNQASPYFIQYNAGKKSVAVDLKSSAGLEVVRSLVARFDVIIENMRPGKLEKLGLGADVCRELNPQLIYTSVTGFGDKGPLRDRPAYDTIGQGFGGLYSLLSSEYETNLSGTILADLITGCVTAMGVLGALVGRATTGRSHKVETSIAEAISTLTIDAMTQYLDTGADPSLQSRHPQAQNFSLATASGESIVIHLSNSEAFWRRLCAALERPDLESDHRFRSYRDRESHYFELAELMKKAFREHTLGEWETRLGNHDVPFSPVLSMSGYSNHPQVAELGIIDVKDKSAGIPLIQPPWRFDGQRPVRTATSPRIGEHTREIALEVLSEETVDSLIASGILLDPDLH